MKKCSGWPKPVATPVDASTTKWHNSTQKRARGPEERHSRKCPPLIKRPFHTLHTASSTMMTTTVVRFGSWVTVSKSRTDSGVLLARCILQIALVHYQSNMAHNYKILLTAAEGRHCAREMRQISYWLSSSTQTFWWLWTELEECGKRPWEQVTQEDSQSRFGGPMKFTACRERWPLEWRAIRNRHGSIWKMKHLRTELKMLAYKIAQASRSAHLGKDRFPAVCRNGRRVAITWMLQRSVIQHD